MGNDCCSGCGAKTLQKHEEKIRRGVYKHDYDGPGKHRKAR